MPMSVRALGYRRVQHPPLAARGPAAKGKVTWTWPAWENIGGNVAANGNKTYASIVVAAYNAAGHSRFVIVKTGEFCSACTY